MLQSGKKNQETNITFARVFSKLSSSSLIISLIFFSLSFNSGNTSPINWTKTFTSLFKNIIISIVNHVSTLRDMHIKKNESRAVDWIFYQRQIHSQVQQHYKVIYIQYIVIWSIRLVLFPYTLLLFPNLAGADRCTASKPC